MKYLIALLLIITVVSSASAQRGGGSNDQFSLNEYLLANEPLSDAGNSNLTGHTCRTDAGGIPCNPTINPANKTLVLITAGASNGATVGPSAFVPTNVANIDNLNIYDGALYVDLDPLLGQSIGNLTACGTSCVGSIGPRLADLLITNGSFNRVILVPVAIGGTNSGTFAPGGVLYDRLCVGMRRLASRGITPSTTGVTFAAIWRMGENDVSLIAAQYEANVAAQTAHLAACGFTGRQFINTETVLVNTANATIQGAQAAMVALGAPYFVGGNMDSLTGSTNRQPDGTHLTATGQASQASLEYTAMHASGSPFYWQPAYAANDNWQALEGCNDNTSDLCKAM